jgi:hypothetical protein
MKEVRVMIADGSRQKIVRLCLMHRARAQESIVARKSGSRSRQARFRRSNSRERNFFPRARRAGRERGEENGVLQSCRALDYK